MRSKLSNSINTFLNNNKTNVAALVRDMKLDKSDFASLIKRITGSSSFNDFMPVQILPLAEMRKEPIVDLFRDSSLRVSRLFNSANATSIILDSMISVLSSDIEKLESDILNLELFINNYEFLAGKDDLYTGNYVEKFDNLLNDYTADGYDFPLVDRDGIDFPPSGNLYIDSNSGVAKIGIGQNAFNIIKNIKEIKIVNNYTNYISSESDFSNLFNDTFNDSWGVTVKSPAVLTSDLSEYLKYINYTTSVPNGAKTAIELTLNSPIYIDTIKFSPNLGNDLQLLQVVLFSKSESQLSATGFTNSENYKILLDAPKVINATVEILFDKFETNKLIFIFNQSQYTRSKKVPINSELNSKALDNFVKKRLEERINKFSKFQDIAYFFFNRRNTIKGLKNNRALDIEYYSYKFPETLHSYAKFVENELIKASNLSKQDNIVFTETPIFTDLVKSMLSVVQGDKKFLNLGYFIDSKGFDYSTNSLSNPGFLGSRSSEMINDPKNQFYKDNYGIGSSQEAIKNLFVLESSDVYEYTFSLRSIEFISTNTKQINKACFVSKKIPANGQILAAKAKVETIENSISTVENDFDIDKYISYELSISNVDYPDQESDWVPVAYNGQNNVSSEVVFFNTNDYSAKLRFKPKTDSIVLYKDGMLVRNSDYEYIINSDRLILKDRFKYSPSSIFCVSYMINDSAYDPYEIDFAKYNIFKESIKQYRTSSGLGQTFSKTSSDGAVEIDYLPYVNSSAISGATYDYYYGTVFPSSFSGYSPVKVMLADGTFAINITNYTRSSQKVEFSTNDSVQFIQTGKNILFNRSISNGFTVMYEYVPYNLRFRFIIRKNVPGIDAPGKVDSVLLKLKTNQFDPFYDKLVYVSKG